MGKPKIPYGYILLSRKLIESEIWDKPPLYLKVWIYILQKAKHTPSDTLKRGETIITIKELQEKCSHRIGYRIEKPTKHQIDNILRWLRKTSEDNTNGETSTPMITATKTTRGLRVIVHNYNVYQNPKNYEYDNEYDSENDNDTTIIRQESDAIVKNDLKNDFKKENNDEEVVVYEEINDKSDAQFSSILKTYSENIESNPPPITVNTLKKHYKEYGNEILDYAIEKSTLAGSKDYRFINHLLKDWKENSLNVIEAIKEYENKRGFNKYKTTSTNFDELKKEYSVNELVPKWLQDQIEKNKNKEPNDAYSLKLKELEKARVCGSSQEVERLEKELNEELPY